jgi:3-deoxy-D-manno-octulosonic acid kinase
MRLQGTPQPAMYPITESRLETKEGGVLFDREADLQWSAESFTTEFWARRGSLTENAIGGRGTVVFVRSGLSEWALRHYRRGGLVGRFLDDHYLWTGENRTRSFREWRLLRHLYEKDLPVPRPIAAAFYRQGATYSADLITTRIPGAEPLSRRLARAPLSDEAWTGIGQCVRQFHDAGAFHADLTAHNLLIDTDDKPWLLDFDRGQLRHPGRWRRANLDRFLRSLRKVSREVAGLHVARRDWETLVRAYGRISA